MTHTVVTPETLEAALENVRTGKVTLYVPTATRCTKIDTQTLKKWEAVGRQLLWVSKDNKGLRMASGKSSVYLLPGQLVAVDN